MELKLIEFIREEMPQVGDWINIPVDPKRMVSISTGQTGWRKKQDFFNEGKEICPCRYIGIKNATMYLVSEPIPLKLMLFGRTGLDNIKNVADVLCRELIESEGMQVRSIQKEDWESLPSNLQYGSYILATKKEKYSFGIKCDGIYFVEDGRLHATYMCVTSKSEYLVISYGIRAIISIPLEVENMKFVESETKGKSKYAMYDAIIA